MHRFIRLLGIVIVAISLSACETTAEKTEVSQPLSDMELNQTYNNIIHNTGDGSVQVFPLDDYPPAAYGAPALSMTEGMPDGSNLPQGDGMSFGNNPNVTVFPLDDARQPSYVPKSAPSLMAPASPLTPAPYDQGMYSGSGDNISRIYFPHGVVTVNTEGKKVVSAFAEQCRASGCGVVKIEGHASTRAVAKDEVQRRMINLKVSMDRAISVSRQLIRAGIPAEAIQITAHGDRVPPAPIPGADSEAASRRVELMTAGAAPLY